MEKHILSDSKLISLYRNGNDGAFEQLLNRHKSKIFTSIKLIVKDSAKAEDIFQDAFVKAIKTINSGKYNEEGKFLPWILRIAHNLSIDHFRKEKRYPTIILEDGSNVFDSLAFSEGMGSRKMDKEQFKKLKKHIYELPEHQKKVLIMRHFLDMSFKEIAERTNVSINTALGRMRYALLNLRKRLEQESIQYDKNFYPE